MAGTQASGESAGEGGVERAPLNRVWLIKILGFMLLLVAFGAYGLYDGLVAYPARGAAYAEWAEHQYLVALKEAESEEFGIFERNAVVGEPASAYAAGQNPEELQDLRAKSGDVNSRESRRATAKLARLEWLGALKTIGRLDPTWTDFREDGPDGEPLYATPGERLAMLNQKWQATTKRPKKLAFYDIPSQWAIMVVCWGVAGWLLVLFLRVVGTRYEWDPAGKRLRLPGGAWVSPDDLEEVDKSKWDKFIVVLGIREGHESLGGERVRLDLYRHAKLEGWVLEMEEAAFGPEEGSDEASEPEPVEAGSSAGGTPAGDPEDD